MFNRSYKVMRSAPVLPFLPNYRLAHHGNYLFLLSKKKNLDQSIQKIFYLILKKEALFGTLYFSRQVRKLSKPELCRWLCLQNSIKKYSDTLILQIYFLIIQILFFRGDLICILGHPIVGRGMYVVRPVRRTFLLTDVRVPLWFEAYSSLKNDP